jgi:hypothetical protein
MKMFELIQEPFKKYCPPDKVNFLPYSFVDTKFDEILEEEYETYIKKTQQLLKSKSTIIKCDEIWEKVCGDLKWHYISSI